MKVSLVGSVANILQGIITDYKFGIIVHSLHLKFSFLNIIGYFKRKELHAGNYLDRTY